MAEFNPKVSIIIPVYNGGNYMREAIDSALSQTYDNFEIIVVNDGSKDNGETERIALTYGDKIRYIHKENGGVSTALNEGIRHMDGEYFSWLSHDDVYTPDKIEKSVSALSRLDDKTTVIRCDSMHIDENSEPINMKHCQREPRLYLWDEALMRLIPRGSMNGCAFLIHRSVFEQCGFFDERLRFNQDGFMWHKMFLNKFSLLEISDVCVKGRIHSKQLTQTGQSIFRGDCQKMSEYLIPELLRISSNESNFLIEYIKYNAKHGNVEVVQEACRVAKDNQLLGIKEWNTIQLLKMYGCIRPTIRKLYYKFFIKVKNA